MAHEKNTESDPDTKLTTKKAPAVQWESSTRVRLIAVMATCAMMAPYFHTLSNAQTSEYGMRTATPIMLKLEVYDFRNAMA